MTLFARVSHECLDIYILCRRPVMLPIFYQRLIDIASSGSIYLLEIFLFSISNYEQQKHLRVNANQSCMMLLDVERVENDSKVYQCF